MYNLTLEVSVEGKVYLIGDGTLERVLIEICPITSHEIVKLKMRDNQHPKGYKVLSVQVRYLVAARHVPNEDPKQYNQILHIDGDENNYCADNLIWATVEGVYSYKYRLLQDSLAVGGSIESLLLLISDGCKEEKYWEFENAW